MQQVRAGGPADYPEIHVNTARQMAGFVGVDAREAAQTTLDGTLGNINLPSVWIDPHNDQSYYVITYYDPHRVSQAKELGELPVRIDAEGRPVLLGAYGDIVRESGPIAVERNHLERALHVPEDAEDAPDATRTPVPQGTGGHAIDELAPHGASSLR